MGRFLIPVLMTSLISISAFAEEKFRKPSSEDRFCGKIVEIYSTRDDQLVITLSNMKKITQDISSDSIYLVSAESVHAKMLLATFAGDQNKIETCVNSAGRVKGAEFLSQVKSVSLSHK